METNLDTETEFDPALASPEAVVEWLVDRRQLGASVSTTLDASPAFEAIDVEDVLELLNAAVTKLARQ